MVSEAAPLPGQTTKPGSERSQILIVAAELIEAIEPPDRDNGEVSILHADLVSFVDELHNSGYLWLLGRVRMQFGKSEAGARNRRSEFSGNSLRRTFLSP